MKFALHFGNNTFYEPEAARRLVRVAEAAGFDLDPLPSCGVNK